MGGITPTGVFEARLARLSQDPVSCSCRLGGQEHGTGVMRRFHWAWISQLKCPIGPCLQARCCPMSSTSPLYVHSAHSAGQATRNDPDEPELGEREAVCRLKRATPTTPGHSMQAGWHQFSMQVPWYSTMQPMECCIGIGFKRCLACLCLLHCQHTMGLVSAPPGV
jgi:hypothetical protein